ncbi:MAG: hypothetical protein KAU95_01755 [Candidatus Aenigmarchaeota archaeon]|nr:hypothetical protein [Candidatus Aenigmarchaeota archaeon]
MGLASQIYNNLVKVKEKELKNLYSDLYPDNGISGIYKEGEGRSLKGELIGTYVLSYYPEKILTTATGESHMFGNDMITNFKNLGKVCNKRTYLISSGSGQSEIPLENLKNIVDGLSDDELAINLITANPDSEIGYIVKSHPKGNIIYLKGRDYEDSKDLEYTEEGIFEDKFELALTRMLSIVSKGIMDEVKPNDFYKFYKEELNLLKKTESRIKELKKDEMYGNYIRDLKNLKKTHYLCGESVSNDVAKMSGIRVNHVRRYIARQVLGEIGLELSPYLAGAWQNYVIGESDVPDMDENSLFVGVSRHGASPKVKKWSKEAGRVGATKYLLTANDKSKIEYENMFVLGVDDFYFYSDASIFLSETLTDLMKKFIKEGHTVDKANLNSVHVSDKIKK